MKENKTEKRNATQRKERRQIRRSAHRYHNNNNNNARASSAERGRVCVSGRESRTPHHILLATWTPAACSRLKELARVLPVSCAVSASAANPSPSSGPGLDPVNIWLMQRALKLYLVFFFFSLPISIFFAVPSRVAPNPAIVVA